MDVVPKYYNMFGTPLSHDIAKKLSTVYDIKGNVIPFQNTVPEGKIVHIHGKRNLSSSSTSPRPADKKSKPFVSPNRFGVLQCDEDPRYMSSPERAGSRTGYTAPPYMSPGGSSFDENSYYGYGPRTGSITPVIDEETRIRVENMERQIANLTGLVQKALTHTPVVTAPFRSDKSVSFEKSVSFSDEPPDMNSPKQHSPQSSEKDRFKPHPPPKPSAVPGQYDDRHLYSDLQLTPEMYNQLRVLQKKAKDLRQEARSLRRMSQAQAHSIRETIKDTFIKIRALIASGADQAWSESGSKERARVDREEDIYKQEIIRLETDLTELESTVEELRGNVINKKSRVNMSDVENMALVLSKSSKTVAELKLRFPSLQESIRTVLTKEMDRAVTEEKFLKDEPDRLESALKRCKKLTGTLVTLKRLASVQEQRLPDPRLSPTNENTPPITPTSSAKCVNNACTDNVDCEQVL